MAFNPYVPPNEPWRPVDSPPAQHGPGQAWTAGVVWNRSWELFKRFLFPLVGTTIVVGLLQFMLSLLPWIYFGPKIFTAHRVERMLKDPAVMMQIQDEVFWPSYGIALAMIPVQAYFAAGLAKLYLKAARGEEPSLGDAFSGGNRLLPMTIVHAIAWLPLQIGFRLMILPGLVVILFFSMVDYYVVDSEMGAIAAIRKGFKDVTADFGKFLLYGLIAAGLTFGGYLACCIGALVTVPLAKLGFAVIFTFITGSAAAPNQFAGYAPQGPPMPMPPRPQNQPPPPPAMEPRGDDEPPRGY